MIRLHLHLIYYSYSIWYPSLLYTEIRKNKRKRETNIAVSADWSMGVKGWGSHFKKIKF
jgi:hypothetical protein